MGKTINKDELSEIKKIFTDGKNKLKAFERGEEIVELLIMADQNANEADARLKLTEEKRASVVAEIDEAEAKIEKANTDALVIVQNAEAQASTILEAANTTAADALKNADEAVAAKLEDLNQADELLVERKAELATLGDQIVEAQAALAFIKAEREKLIQKLAE